MSCRDSGPCVRIRGAEKMPFSCAEKYSFAREQGKINSYFFRPFGAIFRDGRRGKVGLLWAEKAY